MNFDTPTWRKRRKNASRCLARDLRAVAPLMSVVLCFVSSASAIMAAEYLPLAQKTVVVTTVTTDDDYFTISSSSTSNESAAPAGILPVLRLP